MSIIPPYLQKGDTVAIVASARKISLEELQPAIDIINSWGLKVVLPKNVFCTDNQFAGTDEERAADMQWALDEVNIKAIIFARGGYGTVRIIDKLDFTNFIKHPKWIVGYSDITALHQHINQNFSIASLHATMPINFPKNEEATQSLRKALFGETLTYTVPSHLLNRTGEASGELIGGNLSLIYALCGSKSDIDTKGKILFIEDLDEYLYHIDRMMMNLKRSGKLQYLTGLIVGGMSDMKDNTVPFGKTAEEIILDAVKEYNFPVCFDFPAGHIDRNLAIYFNKNTTLSINKSITILAL
jgi:muramoyltetrapeptide carboxypeptidase